MKKRNISLLLAGALALTLAACAPGGEAPGGSPAPAPSQPAETAPASQEPSGPVLATPTPEASLEVEPSQAVELDGALPERDYQPWQVGYMDFLTGLLQAEQDTREAEAAYAGLAVDERGVTAEFSIYDEPPKPLSFVMSMGSESYSLYDVDGDGVPELFVRYGDCEAAYTTQCYTFRDGKIVCIGEFRSGHSSLYTCPDKSAVLRHEGHMGYAELYEYPMEGGVLTEERVLFTEEDVRDYTPTDEIVPGAEYINYYYTRGGAQDDSYWTGQAAYSLGSAMLLPIADYDQGPAATGNSSERARTAILAALNGETQLYGASGDHFYGDVGPTTWAEYLEPGGAYPYNDEPLEVSAHAWQDMNGDGQEELLLRVVTDTGEDNGKPWTSEATVVLSEQGGAVYAYFFGFMDDREAFLDDGAIRQYGEDYRLSFWANQCYEYIAEPSGGSPVKWVDGLPQG